ncbi:helix-turn-helix domain-containing protein [Streptomyces cellulosae]
MPSVKRSPSSGRYLSFEEREKSAWLNAHEVGVRAIARRSNRSPSTVSRRSELAIIVDTWGSDHCRDPHADVPSHHFAA